MEIKDNGSLKKTLAKAYMLIKSEVSDNVGLRIDSGTIISKAQSLSDIEREIELLPDRYFDIPIMERRQILERIDDLMQLTDNMYKNSPRWRGMKYKNQPIHQVEYRKLSAEELVDFFEKIIVLIEIVKYNRP